jgi:hypothetical protein
MRRETETKAIPFASVIACVLLAVGGNAVGGNIQELEQFITS